ncbi:MAG: c-type cytochrome [Sulfuricaulis sp.]
MRNTFFLVVLLLLTTTFAAAANEPVLTLSGHDSKTVYTRTELLQRPDVASVLIVGDVVYRRDMRYRAVPVAALLEQFHPEPDSVIQFIATDGFAAELPVAPLLNRDSGQAVAYLAVEPPDKPWPALEPGSKLSAGPFYLVWLNPRRAHISPEQWPYQVARIEVRPSLRQRWPALVPGPDNAGNSAISRGFASYQQHCFACHTLNRNGDATKGPDLNVPMNPTEYFQPQALRKLIRSPQSVRIWSGQSMPAFDEKTLSDRELEDLLAYLKYMAGRKADAR